MVSRKKKVNSIKRLKLFFIIYYIYSIFISLFNLFKKEINIDISYSFVFNCFKNLKVIHLQKKRITKNVKSSLKMAESVPKMVKNGTDCQKLKNSLGKMSQNVQKCPH